MRMGNERFLDYAQDDEVVMLRDEAISRRSGTLVGDDVGCRMHLTERSFASSG